MIPVIQNGLPDHAMVTAFPDGRIVPADSTMLNNYMEGNRGTYENERIWTDDTLFLINELESIQAGERESLFVGKLDMARLGIFGVSFGGATAVKVCSIDDRCQAGVSLDGGLAVDSPLKKPFMLMANEGWASYVRAALNAVENTAYGVTVRGATHFHFADLPLYSPVFKFIFFDLALYSPVPKLTQVSDPIGGYRMVEIVNDYTLAFFDKHLKGEASPLLDGPSPDYPEVVFQLHVP